MHAYSLSMSRRRPSRSGHRADLEKEKDANVSNLDGAFDVRSHRSRRHPKGLDRREFKWTPCLLAFGVIGLLSGLLWLAWHVGAGSCNNYLKGFWCHPPTAQLWGQYSAYHTLTKTDALKREQLQQRLDPTVPPGCYYDVVSILSRHGARGPTSHKNELYNATVRKIQQHLYEKRNTVRIKDKYRFLRTYKLKFKPDELNDFGRKQLEDSGRQIYLRYATLNSMEQPFIRAADQHRVVESAERWRKGFVDARNVNTEKRAFHPKAHNGMKEDTIPIHEISERDKYNNTLHHSRCTSFEGGVWSDVGEAKQKCFAEIAFSDLTDHLNKDLSTDIVSHLYVNDTINLMQLCAFDTLGSKHPARQLSPFCRLFNKDQFLDLDYYETIGKFYGYSHGNALGPTQGVGWVNELVARLTNMPVKDTTSTNRTLDADKSTFPLPKHGTRFFADFTHDNDLVAAVSALGLFKGIDMDTSRRLTIIESKGFSSAWLCPFASRVFVEKLICPTSKSRKQTRKRQGNPIAEYLLPGSRDGTNDQIALADSSSSTPEVTQAAYDEKTSQGYVQGDDEYVRVIINDRIIPMDCRSEEYSKYGLCLMRGFLDQLEWARRGGEWDRCFEDEAASEAT